MSSKGLHTRHFQAALALSILAVSLMFASPANAGNIAINQIGEYDGPILNNPSYPQPSITIGTFVYTIPVGTEITAATVSGYFGTSVVGETALENLYVGGIEVAACTSENDPCWNGDPITGEQTSWTYTFTPDEFAVLDSGSVDYDVVQTGDFQVESGVTTLDITVAPTPEPSTVAMFCGGLSLFLIVRRKQRA
jgi:hypothetical protein